MKKLLILPVAGLLGLSQLSAQSESTEKKVPDVYIERQAPVNAQIKIVTGKASITGQPKRGKEKAFLAWERACQAWKHELKKLNKKNLLVANCGRPSSRKEDKDYFLYYSNGDYKIKAVAP